MAAFSPACGSPGCDIEFFLFPVYVSMLIVEDGSIVANADTFADADDVATYATRYGFTWTGTDLAKEQAILRAMIYIESLEGYLAGQRVGNTQTLSWPRNYVPAPLRNGTYLSATAVPSGVVNALSEAAIAELATPGVLTADVEHSSRNVKRTRDKLGPLETEVEYAGGTDLAAKTYTRILEFLRPYIKGSGARYSVRGH